MEVRSTQISADETIKFVFALSDGHLVEGVLIPKGKRITACISSQVGCSLSCLFCATGRMERARNLTTSEIIEQVLAIKHAAIERYGVGVSNVVYMGMGEPLLNYAAVTESIRLLSNPATYGIAPKRITVSTAGIAKMIVQLGEDKVKANLALSLHAANDIKRNQIMGINASNSLDALALAMSEYYRLTKKAITLEYILFQDFNDGVGDAMELADFSKRVPSKINIIEYNPILDGAFFPSSAERLKAFHQCLVQQGAVVNLRRSRGKDIAAACGQLVK